VPLRERPASVPSQRSTSSPQLTVDRQQFDASVENSLAASLARGSGVAVRGSHPGSRSRTPRALIVVLGQLIRPTEATEQAKKQRTSGEDSHCKPGMCPGIMSMQPVLEIDAKTACTSCASIKMTCVRRPLILRLLMSCLANINSLLLEKAKKYMNRTSTTQGGALE
jgi:hypothetical protein